GDIPQCRFGQPAAALLLGPPQQRNDGGELTSLRIATDPHLGPLEILRRELEALRLDGLESSDAHRSTSPNTMSIEPSTAATSASMCPLVRRSMPCRWTKLGARILQR